MTSLASYAAGPCHPAIKHGPRRGKPVRDGTERGVLGQVAAGAGPLGNSPLGTGEPSFRTEGHVAVRRDGVGPGVLLDAAGGQSPQPIVKRTTNAPTPDAGATSYHLDWPISCGSLGPMPGEAAARPRRRQRPQHRRWSPVRPTADDAAGRVGRRRWRHRRSARCSPASEATRRARSRARSWRRAATRVACHLRRPAPRGVPRRMAIRDATHPTASSCRAQTRSQPERLAPIDYGAVRRAHLRLLRDAHRLGERAAGGVPTDRSRPTAW